MARWVLSPSAAEDLEQLTDFLMQRMPDEAARTVDLVVDALNILEEHPRIGRPLEFALRELVISRGKTGYLALYEYDEQSDLVIVLALRHQREQDYH
jgi:plasmid stabilization system protein ParE